MYRINQYRPNLKTDGKVKERQWSEKLNEQGVKAALGQMSYYGRRLNHSIKEVQAFIDENGNITTIWITCGNPNYSWDSYNSYMVYYRAKKRDYSKTREELDKEANNYLVQFLEAAEVYFNEENLDVTFEIVDEDCRITNYDSITELINNL